MMSSFFGCRNSDSIENTYPPVFFGEENHTRFVYGRAKLLEMAERGKIWLFSEGALGKEAYESQYVLPFESNPLAYSLGFLAAAFSASTYLGCADFKYGTARDKIYESVLLLSCFVHLTGTGEELSTYHPGLLCVKPDAEKVLASAGIFDMKFKDTIRDLHDIYRRYLPNGEGIAKDTCSLVLTDCEQNIILKNLPILREFFLIWLTSARSKFIGLYPQIEHPCLQDNWLQNPTVDINKMISVGLRNIFMAESIVAACKSPTVRNSNIPIVVLVGADHTHKVLNASGKIISIPLQTLVWNQIPAITMHWMPVADASFGEFIDALNQPVSNSCNFAI